MFCTNVQSIDLPMDSTVLMVVDDETIE